MNHPAETPGPVLTVPGAPLAFTSWPSPFASKEDLVATAVANQLREQRASFSERAPGRAGVACLGDIDGDRTVLECGGGQE